MTGSKISALNSATSIASNDLLAIVNLVANETQKVTAQVLGKALVQLGISVGPTQPTSPYEGQPWMDTSVSPPVLRAYNGAGWSVLSVGATSVVTSPGGTAPAAPGLGTLWQDTGQTPDELKMWDGAGWVRVDPQGITQTAADARYLQPATAASTYMPLSGGTFTGAVTLAGAPSTNLQPATKLYVDTAVSGIVTVAVPPGAVIWTARNSAPTGYLKANGAAISRSTYADLFAAIGTAFGAGDGSTTFNLPDLRGEFVRGWDDGRGADSGRAFGSSQADEYRAHNHGGSVGTAGDHSHQLITNGMGGGAVGPSEGGLHAGTGKTTSGTTTNGAHIHPISSSGGVETRPRNVALLACIKT